MSQKPVREMVPLREERARVEAAEDTLRRKDADVQPMQGGERSMTERERATAADRSRPPLAGRDPDAAGSSLGGGTLRKPRKDKPTP